MLIRTYRKEECRKNDPNNEFQFKSTVTLARREPISEIQVARPGITPVLLLRNPRAEPLNYRHSVTFAKIMSKGISMPMWSCTKTACIQYIWLSQKRHNQVSPLRFQGIVSHAWKFQCFWSLSKVSNISYQSNGIKFLHNIYIEIISERWQEFLVPLQYMTLWPCMKLTTVKHFYSWGLCFPVNLREPIDPKTRLLLQFCVLATEAWNVGQGHKPLHGISRSCQDEQLG